MRIALLLPVFFITVANAQPVIDRSNYFEIGDSALLYFKYDTSLWSVDPGLSGENVTWDLSGVDITHPSVIVDTLMFIDPVGTPFYPSSMSADYSDANICMLRKTEPFFPENNDYNYYFAGEDSLAFLGHWADNGGTELWEDHYPDPLRELIFPLTFSDSYNDQYTRYFVDQSGSGAHFLEGTYSVTVDGYGTLITPENLVLEDAMRLHIVNTATDSSVFGVETTVHHSYMWYAESTKGFIVSMKVSLVPFTQVETLYYQKQSDLSTSIEERPAGNELIVVNDGNTLIVSLKNGGAIRSLKIFDPAGKLIRSIEGKGDRIVIDRNGLAAGVHVIQIRSSDRRIISGKFLVE